MSFINRLGGLFSFKESQTRIVSSMQQVGKAQPTPANYDGFARLGYSKNAVVYIAVSKIATACAGIDWCLYRKGAGRRKEKIEILDSPLLNLLDKPNPDMARAQFIENVVAYFKITGNSYIEANTGLTGSVPLELWPASPDKMKVVPNANGYVAQYEYATGAARRVFPVDPVKMTSKIMHWKSFNPINLWYGLSPLEAALLSLDQNSAGQKWNLALLQNSATPSGVLQMKVTDINPRGALTKEQYDRLKNEFDENFQGSKNAGRPMILEGGLNWQQISLGPKDMDFLQNKNVTATDIFAVYGVPGELVGLGQKTFANYKEARQSFYEDTILPTMDSLKDKLNQWLTPAFGEGLYLDYDKDDIEALVEKREAKYTSLSTASFLNENEKREAAGYDRVEGLDLFKIGTEILSMEDLKLAAEEGSTDPKTSLSGIQITSLLEVINSVATEKIPRETGLQIIMVSFNLTAEQAEAILSEVGNGFKPKPEVEPNATNNTPQNTPPKKPQTDEANNEPSDDDTDEESEKGFKSINLVNANEKRQSWKRQNAKRKRLTNYFEKDLQEDFRDLLNNMKNTASNLQGREERLVEFGLVKDVSDWVPALRKTLKKHTKYALEEFGLPIIDEAKSKGLVIEAKKDLDFDSFVESYINRRTSLNISTITNTTEKQIKRIVKEWTAQALRDGDSVQDLSFFLEAEFEGLGKSNATRIARTEVAIASNNGALEAVKSLQIPGMVKEWVSANDSRVRDGGDNGLGADHSSVADENGEIPIDEKFKVNPDVLMDGPGDTGAPADQVINCRCVLVFKNKGGGQ